MPTPAKHLPRKSEERYGQLYCGVCRKPVGFTEQPAAYASLISTDWLCPKHNDEEERQMRKDAKESITRKT